MCEELTKVNPVWLVAFVNFIALLLAPYLTYKYVHKNNLKLLREKWIAQVREATVRLLRASEGVYRANLELYNRLQPAAPAMPPGERQNLDERLAVAQGDFYAARCELRLLFKNGDTA